MRERLIGAAAIVVVGIVVIPWLVSRARFAHELNQSRPLSVPVSTAGTSASPDLVLALPPLASTPAGTSAPASAPAATRTHPALASASAATRTHPAPTAAAVPPSSAEPVSGWSVQVASVTDPGAAATLAAKLIHAGFKAFVSPHLLNGKTWYRVRVGPYPDAASAKAAEAKIAAVSGTRVILQRLRGAGG